MDAPEIQAAIDTFRRAYAKDVPRPSDWTPEECKSVAAPPMMIQFKQCGDG